MKKVAISVGDINGIGLEILFFSHDIVKKICSPYYIINKKLLNRASKLLNIKIPNGFEIVEVGDDFEINPGIVSKDSGKFSHDSFLKAIELAQIKEVDAICTMPINKEAWSRAGIKEAGHTAVLSKLFNQEAIMMIGCDKLFTSFFTHHIPLKDVAPSIDEDRLVEFLITFQKSVQQDKIGVLGLNPHAGDGGVIGDEEKIICSSIDKANEFLSKKIFYGPLVPDTAFTSAMREQFSYYVCMYHDQGLIAVKSLFFDESINVSLNLPIVRTSVDHGTAYDKAYKGKNPSNLSYINAIKEAIKDK